MTSDTTDPSLPEEAQHLVDLILEIQPIEHYLQGVEPYARHEAPLCVKQTIALDLLRYMTKWDKELCDFQSPINLTTSNYDENQSETSADPASDAESDNSLARTVSVKQGNDNVVKPENVDISGLDIQKHIDKMIPIRAKDMDLNHSDLDDSRPTEVSPAEAVREEELARWRGMEVQSKFVQALFESGEDIWGFAASPFLWS